MKRFALKGLGILAMVVLLCLFFSGTIHTIMTAKVSLASPRSGKLESTLTLTGSLYWADSVWISATHLQEQDSLAVLNVNIQRGSWVKTGDILVSCEVTDFDSRMNAFRSEYESKSKELLELDRKYGEQSANIRQQGWFQAYEALLEASEAVRAAREELRVAAGSAGTALQEDKLPENVTDEKLLALQANLTDAVSAEEKARAAFERQNRYAPGEDLIYYLQQKADLKRQITLAADSMVALRLLRETGCEIVAPYDGYILSCDLKSGDTLTRNAAIAQITAQDTVPVIRLDASNVRKAVQTGSAVEISAGGSQTVSAGVTAQSLSEEGSSCIDVELTHRDIVTLGGFSSLSEANAVTGVITTKAEQSSTLVPTSAIRGNDQDHYIFLAAASTDAFGAEKLTVLRKNVTILGQSGNVTSVKESLQNERIIYMEDRPISEGCEVMQYDSQ